MAAGLLASVCMLDEAYIIQRGIPAQLQELASI